jgi:hypothetical protein
MVRIAIALTAAIIGLAVLAPAAGAKGGSSVTPFVITKADAVIRVSFAGNEAAGCRDRGVCGVSGTSTYSFGGKPKEGFLFLQRHRGRTRYAFGYLETAGETVADVATAGSPERCVDRVVRGFEQLYFEPHGQRMRFFWRYFPDEDDLEGEDPELILEDQTDPFDTRCAGPALRDLAVSEALPVADLPFRPFRQHRGTLATTATKPFSAGGFAGTVQWDIRYGIQRAHRTLSGFFAIR